MHRWYKPEKGMAPPQIADAYCDMIFNGLVAPR